MKQPPLGLTKPVEIISVIDGDTIKGRFIIDLDIRLDGVDTPETSKPKSPEEKKHGLEATKFLKEFLKGKKEAVLHIPFKELNKFKDVTTLGRIVGRIFIDGQDLSEIMLENGYKKGTYTEDGKYVI